MITEPGLNAKNAIQTKLRLAEEILEISNRNIQLTIEILVRANQEAEPLLTEQAENAARIRLLVQTIREQAQSDKEKELLDAAGARWLLPNLHQQALRGLISGQKGVEAGTATADVMLPLLLDNSSWRAFVQFLQVELECRTKGQPNGEEIVTRSRALVRANQELKSKVAERKRIDERLSQLGSIIESSSDAIVIHALDGTMVSWNAGAESVYGYAASEVLGKSRKLLIAPGQRDELPRILEALDHGEQVRVYEAVHVRKDGQRIDVSTAISPVKDAEGKIVGVAAITRDISDRKKAEERFYKAFNANPEPITIATLDEGRYIDVNESFLRITGCRREEVIGHTSMELRFWERVEDRAALIKALEVRGSVRDLEITFLTKSGEQRIGMNSAEIIDIGGEKCIISIFRDMTDQKTLEKQLRKAQRMEAIGQLSGGIAHDFNNLLTVMIGHSEILEERLAKYDASFKSVEEIKKAGTHAASLTRQLLAFSRQQMLAPEVLDLNAVITDLEKMLRRLIGEDIELSTSLDPELARIKADHTQVQQVIMNLVVNARDAMPDGGELRIRTAKAQQDETFIRNNWARNPADYVLLEISDTGTGMSAETQAHIFEPFFSTKEVGKGTGLGLSTVYGVVKQSGGYIWVDSKPGHGATFKVYLPRTAEAVTTRKAAPSLPESLRGNETILLVEDANAVRELSREWLMSAGYTVLEAERADDAIRIAQQYKRPIDLLLTDVIMPGMNGTTLAKHLSATRPETKVLYMSGYTGFRDQTCFDSDAIALAKPFTRDALLLKIREVLRMEVVSVSA